MFFEAPPLAERIATRHGLAVALRPHFATVTEPRHRVLRWLRRSQMRLSQDTDRSARMTSARDPGHVKVADEMAAALRPSRLRPSHR